MSQSSAKSDSTPVTTPKTPPAESELSRFGRLLDEFFANIAL